MGSGQLIRSHRKVFTPQKPAPTAGMVSDKQNAKSDGVVSSSVPVRHGASWAET